MTDSGVETLTSNTSPLLLPLNNTANENNLLNTITPSRNLDLVASLNAQQLTNNSLSYLSRIQTSQQHQQQRSMTNEDLLVFPFGENDTVTANYLFDNSITGK